MTALTLVSHSLCPYVQRAAIALAEKGVPFERVNVDLNNKPDWFLAISPLGKVPLLKVSARGEETVIFESSVIVEYLEETQANPLHPEDPLQRARQRSWMEFGSAILNKIARLYGAKSKTDFERARAALRVSFERLETELADRDAGPFFDGEQFTLVDAVYGPIFRYFTTFENRAKLRILDDLPKVADWREALSHRQSVREAVDDNYPELLTLFIGSRESYMSNLTV